MNFQFSTLWTRPALTLGTVVGLTLCGQAAHAQCGIMTARTAIAWNTLPGNAVAAFSNPAPRVVRAEPARGDQSIVGMWKTTFTAGGVVVDQAFETFHSDGTELMVDTAPPASGNVCTGVWARVNGINYKLNHPSWTFDDKGNLNGTAVIKMNVLLDPNSNHFSGTFTVDVMNLSGTLLEHLTGSITGERLNVD